MFTVTGVAGQKVSLALGNTAVGTDVDASLGTDTANAGTGVALQYFNGTNWVDYTPASLVAIPVGGTTLLVRTAITNDSAYEGAETFTLSATNTGGTAATGIATIKDDGTGDKYPNNNTGATDNSGTLDDDRTVTVNSITVNEGSPFAFFTVMGGANQNVRLALANGTATSADYGPTLEVSTDGGSTWATYTPGPNSYVTLNSAGQLLVRTPVIQDFILEYSETFTLTATNTAGSSATGTAAIVDEGNGTLYNADGSENTTTLKDDDRPKPAPPAPVIVLPTPAAPVPALVLPVFSIPAPAPFDSAINRPLVRDIGPVIRDILTSNSGFRTVVSETATPGLSVNRGVTDQFVDGAGPGKVSLPADAFVHSRTDAVVTLEAKLADNSALPSWVQFNPQTGSFEVNAPKNFKGKLDIKVNARDDDGKEATVIFRIFVGEQPGQSDQPAVRPGLQGRNSLSEKLRLIAAKRSGEAWAEKGIPQAGQPTAEKVAVNRVPADMLN